MAALKIGNYVLLSPTAGKIWINNVETEEGGAFDANELEMLIEQFWKERF